MLAEGCAAPLVVGALFLLAMTGCGSGTVTPPSAVPGPPPALTITDVQNVVQAGAEAADPDTMVIAVVDRAGRVLAVFRKPNAPATATGNFGLTVDANDLAVALARTAAFFSNDQAPLSSRTVRFISGIHFPPGVQNAPNGALYGIENTNRGCTLATNYLPGQQVPVPSALKGQVPTQHEEKLNHLLQEAAWEAATNEPLTGVKN